VTTLQSTDHVLVVGAGLAGWRFVEAVRREGFDGSITLVGEEVHPPYDRPPLTKQILAGKWDLDHSTLATPARLESARTTYYGGRRVASVEIDPVAVTLASGERLVGTHLVIATGTRARALATDGVGSLPTLRTLDDARVVLDAVGGIDAGGRVVIIGGGFLGAESATSLTTRGLEVVVVEAAARPLLGVVGEEASSWLEALPERFGVEMRTRATLRDVTRGSGGFNVELGEDSLTASYVLAAVGSSLELDWLTSSGLHLDGGVVVNEHLEAAPHVGAIGDVARFPLTDAAGTDDVRVEHWQVAADHALRLAHYWVQGSPPPAPLIPYFWSDQYGQKIQMLGHPHPSDEVTRVSGDDASAQWLALYARAGLVTGALALNQPRALTLARAVLNQPTTLDDALRAAPWST